MIELTKKRKTKKKVIKWALIKFLKVPAFLQWFPLCYLEKYCLNPKGIKVANICYDTNQRRRI